MKVEQLNLLVNTQTDTPLAGQVKIYAKADKKVYIKNADGLESSLLLINKAVDTSVSFSTYLTNTLIVTALTQLIVLFNAIRWNDSNYYNTVNGRFTPLIAGKWAINARLLILKPSGAQYDIRILKNGLGIINNTENVGVGTITINTIVEVNGIDDYLQIRIDNSDVSDINTGQNIITNEFSGFLIR